MAPQPANAIYAEQARQGWTVADLDLLEIKEAFAAMAVHAVRHLGVACPATAPVQLVRKVAYQPCSGLSGRVAQRDRATVHVDPVWQAIRSVWSQFR